MSLTAEVIIHDSAEARVDVRIERENIWLSLQQIAEQFGRGRSVNALHLRRIFARGELEREVIVAKTAMAAAAGKTYPIEYDNLGAFLSMGYSLNRKRFEPNAAELALSTPAGV